jgi:hypothetical protein
MRVGVLAIVALIAAACAASTQGLAPTSGAIVDGFPLGAVSDPAPSPDLEPVAAAALDVRMPGHAAIVSSSAYQEDTALVYGPGPVRGQLLTIYVFKLADGSNHGGYAELSSRRTSKTSQSIGDGSTIEVMPATPDPESAIVAVDILKAQLAIVASNLDSLDRKVVLLPPFMIGLGTLLLPPAPWSWLQVVLVAAALGIGIRSVWYVRWIVLPQDHFLGPTSANVAANVDKSAPWLRAAIAHELAVSINNGVALASLKSAAFRHSANWAGAAILCLIFARAAGGFAMADQSGQGGSSPAPSQTQPASPAPSTPVPATGTPAAPSAPPPVGENNVPPLGQQTIQGTEPGALGQQAISLGQQLMARDTVTLGQQRMEKAWRPQPRPPVEKEG